MRACIGGCVWRAVHGVWNNARVRDRWWEYFRLRGRLAVRENRIQVLAIGVE